MIGRALARLGKPAPAFLVVVTAFLASAFVLELLLLCAEMAGMR